MGSGREEGKGERGGGGGRKIRKKKKKSVRKSSRTLLKEVVVGEEARLDACRDGLTHSLRRRASARPTKAGDGD